MLKVQFGAGGNVLPGWVNHDIEVDVRDPLPYKTSSVSAIFAEHLIEHLTIHEAWNFLNECYRILVPQGLIRLSFPDLAQFSNQLTWDYVHMEHTRTGCGQTFKDTFASVMLGHGHQSAWTAPLLISVLSAIGFVAFQEPVGQSKYEVLRGLEQHGKIIGDTLNRTVSAAVTGCKV